MKDKEIVRKWKEESLKELKEVEVDFVLEKPDGSVFGIEVKKSESVTIQDFKGIKAFEELTGKDFAGGVVLYAGKDAVPFGKNLWAVPFFALW